ncbi:MAG: iron ABC transporter permease [Eubacteriales bacterium]|nr:iron ABC transporter permease [Eubacteriales bacterium]MDD4582585.1 iron ABC transporter permease [Eubacteriales bacterium]
MIKLTIQDKNNSSWLILFLLFTSIIILFGSLAVGFYEISINDILCFLFRGETAVNDEVSNIIRNIRIPRIIAAYIIGAGLSISGAAYQGMFKNPLVSPDILGVSTGAGLGAALAITLRLPYFMVQINAFVFGILVVSLAYFIGTRAKFGHEISLILAGTMLGSLASSLITVLKYLADPNDILPAITFWLMGSLSKVNASSVSFSLVPIAVGSILIYSLRWRLNLLTLGDEEAEALGIDPKKIRLLAVTAATVISSAAVCLGGLIGWVGLMIPHLSRGIVGADYRRMLPTAALMGGSFLLLMDNLARSLSIMEIPLGVLTAVMGAPFFIMLIIKRER